MTGIKGQTWDKPKVVKHNQSIQLLSDDLSFVEKISKLKEWSKAKVIYKIFSIGRKYFKGE